MKPLRRIAAAAVEVAAGARLLDLLERSGGSDSRVLRVLTYHRVVEPGDAPLYPGVVSGTPAVFAAQMRAIAGRFRVVPLADVVTALRERTPLPPRALLVTFDDAYRDFADHAWPVLRSLGLPAVLFVPTGFPDRPERVFWWDRLYRAVISARRAEPLPSAAGALPLHTPAERERSFARVRDRVKALPHREAMELVARVCGALEASPLAGEVLGWERLRALAREGVALCAHTRTHALLDQIRADEVRTEIQGSLVDLRREIGEPLPVLAYPDGHYDRDALLVAREVGIEVGFTTHRGVNDLRNTDPLQLRRVPVTSSTSDALLRAQLLAVTALSTRPWRPRALHRPRAVRVRVRSAEA
jgi:peptidoglycan/xylan/chitin deacetylase (PgdA/CDA1 family)